LKPHCVDCGSSRVELVGAIPPAMSFAGRWLCAPLNGGELFRCDACSLQFRSPSLSKTELDGLYELGRLDHWQTPAAARPDWQLATKWISRFFPHPTSILDVGCFDGGFLKAVGSRHKRYGIEIHEAASARAKESGLEILGTDFATLDENKFTFDVTTAFDVIEHTHRPIDFLSKLASVTRQNGVVILASGNSEAPTWKLLRGRYWYCTIPEHLTFISPTWCSRAASSLGLELKEIAFFSHGDTRAGNRLNELAKNCCYAMFPRTWAWLRSQGFGAEEYRRHPVLLDHPPTWMSAKDHFICLFVKK
jgi:SAM-dependent methyltransferase